MAVCYNVGLMKHQRQSILPLPIVREPAQMSHQNITGPHNLIIVPSLDFFHQAVLRFRPSYFKVIFKKKGCVKKRDFLLQLTADVVGHRLLISHVH